MGFHAPLVRSQRTEVKLDCVRPIRTEGGMASGETMGEKLAQLRARSGLSLTQVAKAGGWSGRSSVQRFFDAGYNPDYIPMDVAQRLVKAFEGTGNPVITVQEILTLAGVPEERSGGTFAVKDQIGSIASLPRDVPIYGTALGSEASFDLADGTGTLEIEQAELDQSEVLGYLRRPPALAGRKDVYGVYISGASMYPRFSDGEGVFVDPKRPPRIGDDVIVHLVAPDEHDGERVAAVLIKRLVRRSSSFIELEQFNPAVTFRLDMKMVRAVHRIIPTAELLS